MTSELSIIVPTLSEEENVGPLIEALDRALQGISWEVIIVDDDSPDGTARTVRRMAMAEPRVRCIQRLGRRGLSSACIEGMLASSAPFLAVIDADMQHDETRLPLMLETLKRDGLDIVIGSRYMAQGSTGEVAASRVRVSRLATLLSRLKVKSNLTDPMSGFFILRRSFLETVVRRLSIKGFKILLDLFSAAGSEVTFREIPYEMRSRARGESKLDTVVALEYLMLLVDKLIGWVVPVRFVLFCLVGLGGVAVHLIVLGILFRMLEFEFVISQAAAAIIAMTQNYLINNVFTYRDKRQHGRALLSGLARFYLICGAGAVVSVVLADFLFDLAVPWWLAGLLGAAVGAVWNFAVTSVFIWAPTRSRG